MSIASRLSQYLADAQVDYEVVEHFAAPSSSRTAEAAHVPGDRLAKAITQNRGQGGGAAGIVKALQNHVGVAHRPERRHRRMDPVLGPDPDIRRLGGRAEDEQHHDNQ